MKKQLTLSFGLVCLLLLQACKKEETYIPPALSTGAALGITTNAATVPVVVTTLGTGTTIEYGLVYGTADNPTTANGSKVTLGSSLTAATTANAALASLTPGTTYYARSYLRNQKETYYGNSVNFATLSLKLGTVKTGLNANEITTSSFSMPGSVDDLGTGGVTQHGHCLSETNATPTVADAKTELGALTTAPKAFTSPFTGLKPNTLYYVRGYVTNTAGTAYGTVVQIRTAEVAVAFAPPAVEMRATTNVTPTTVTLNAVITTLGNKPIPVYGFAYSDTDPDPKARSNNSISAGGTPSGTLPIAYKVDLKDLKANTKYYVRAFITAQLDNATPQPKTQTIESAVTTFTTTADASLSGSWKAVTFTNDLFFLTSRSFQYENTLYEASSLSSGFSTYDLSTKKYTRTGTPPLADKGKFHNVQLVGKKAYLLMPYASSSSKPDKEVWEYDLDAKKWTRKADFPGIARVDGKAVTLGGKLYFGTGNEYTTKNNIATTLSDWWEYDPATDKWTEKAKLPVAKYGLNGFVVNGKAVLGMGNSFAGNAANNPESWYEYNPQTNAWRALRNFTGDYTGGFIMDETVGGKGYALMLNKARTKYSMWQYKPDTDTWTRAAELPFTPSVSDQFGFFVFNGKPHVLTRDKMLVFEFTP